MQLGNARFATPWTGEIHPESSFTKKKLLRCAVFLSWEAQRWWCNWFSCSQERFLYIKVCTTGARGNIFGEISLSVYNLYHLYLFILASFNWTHSKQKNQRMSLFWVYSFKKRCLDLGVWWGTYSKIQVAEVDNEKISIFLPEFIIMKKYQYVCQNALVIMEPGKGEIGKVWIIWQ